MDPWSAFQALTTCRQHAPPPGDPWSATNTNENQRDNTIFATYHRNIRSPVITYYFDYYKRTVANTSSKIIIFLNFLEKVGCTHLKRDKCISCCHILLLFLITAVALTLCICANFRETISKYSEALFILYS